MKTLISLSALLFLIACASPAARQKSTHTAAWHTNASNRALLPLWMRAQAKPLPSAAAEPTPTLTFRWQYPTNYLSSNLWFTIYGSNTSTQPNTNWTVFAHVSTKELKPVSFTTVSNIVMADYLLRVYVPPDRWWFSMTSSNEWHQSSFGSVASLPYPPRSDMNFEVRVIR